MEQEQQIPIIQEKVIDTKKNITVFSIEGEDHTLGNLIRCQIERNKSVIFSGYQMPHPLHDLIEVRVQTIRCENPKSVFVDSIRTLEREANDLLSLFQIELERWNNKMRD